jgi:hypothetical protein
MTITSIDPPCRAGDADARAALLADVRALEVFLATHEDLPDPGDDDGNVIVNIRVPKGERGERLAALDIIADILEVDVVKENGTLWAKRPFGRVLLEAHVRDEDYTSELLKAADRRDAAKSLPVYTRYASEAEVDQAADRWAAQGKRVRRPLADNPDDLTHEAILLGEDGKPAEVAWWCPLEDAPAQASGSAA